ncbi:phage scaffolding protein [Clostridium beijerinckii]|jgi:Phage minor structural protein GP20.|uniref:phage scaffolding protein n=1 Tax=Clostridium beijerinckii TaxID=1520 RepID=UPI001361C37B|nr:phage scaffolding protein [Clostridium beijerinckii]MZK53668.1 phage capsid protein [Clostridium beijerinckii]MZK61797.1 phage capsid protein [Clostridium beijerinckii]MZK71978.1 phage capsid protein [Clostridium beijerinckii]MZK77371.1 phage capsid protein [Clostridium beijerinckii]MZK86949.1 phage capsid protein [Clostridium beijerinckii]
MAHIKEIIGEEAYNALSEDKRKELGKKDFEDISNGDFVPKSKFEQVSDQAKEYKKQVGERDTQLKDLKDQYKDVDGLKDKVTELENANKTQKDTYEKQLSDISFNNALEKGLGAFKVKDKALIMALINKENLKVDGDNIIGLKEQIEPLQKSHEYLFEKEINGTGSFGTGGSSSQTTSSDGKENIATVLGKHRAEAAKSKSILDFAK